MKIKRSMAVILLSLMSMISVPVFAVALPGDATPVRAFSLDPAFLVVVLIALFALGASLILTCVLLHVHRISCKNTSCVYHPRSSVDATFDFAHIKTPEELLAYPYGEEKGERRSEGAGETSPNGSVDEAILSVLADVEGFAQVAGESRDLGGASGFEPGEWEIEEPHEYPSMEFTDDMILRVLAALEQQQQAAVRQQTAAVTVARQQATIAVLVTESVSRGKHFKTAATALSESGRAVIEELPSRRSAMQGHGKHARAKGSTDERTSFRRVS
jgi:hypothetical protein